MNDQEQQTKPGGGASVSTAGTVTESIYSGKTAVIPLADVSHVQRRAFGIQVVTKHTTYNAEIGDYNNAAWIDKEQAPAFLSAWCRYRGELEAATLADLTQNVGIQPTPKAVGCNDGLGDIRQGNK